MKELIKISKQEKLVLEELVNTNLCYRVMARKLKISQITFTIIANGVYKKYNVSNRDDLRKRVLFQRLPFSKLDEFEKILSDSGKSALITIASRVGMGKTTLLLNLLERYCSKDKKCLYFSDNETKEELTKRILCQIANIDFNPEYRKVSEAQALEKLTSAIKTISKWKVVVYDNSKDIEQEIQKQKPDYIFIDFKENYKSIENLKEFAEKYGTTIFLSAKIKSFENRDNSNIVYPWLTLIERKDELLKYSDEIILLSRVSYYDCTVPELEKKSMDLMFEKKLKRKLKLEFNHRTGKIC